MTSSARPTWLPQILAVVVVLQLLLGGAVVMAGSAARPVAATQNEPTRPSNETEDEPATSDLARAAALIDQLPTTVRGFERIRVADPRDAGVLTVERVAELLVPTGGATSEADRLRSAGAVAGQARGFENANELLLVVVVAFRDPHDAARHAATWRRDPPMGLMGTFRPLQGLDDGFTHTRFLDADAGRAVEHLAVARRGDTVHWVWLTDSTGTAPHEKVERVLQAQLGEV